MGQAARFAEQYGVASKEYDDLWSTVDESSTPYASKYAARDIIVRSFAINYIHISYEGLIIHELQEKLINEVDNAVRESERVHAVSMETREDCSKLRDILAFCHVRMGVNYVQTEENQTGEAHLLLAAQWLVQRFGISAGYVSIRSVSAVRDSPLSPTAGLSSAGTAEEQKGSDAPAGPSPFGRLLLLEIVHLACACLECSNYLALLYSGWDNHARALKCLRVAKKVYRRVRALQNQRKFGEQCADGSDAAAALLPIPPSAASSTVPHCGSDAFLSLDSLFTHTLFYYAQVYGHLGCPIIAAGYIESTLCRQLSEQVAAALATAEGIEKDRACEGGQFGVDAEAEHEAAMMRSEGPDWALGFSAASLDRLEWAKNALRLGAYHSSRTNWNAAALCFVAAETMLGTIVAQAEAASSQDLAIRESSAAVEINGASGERLIDKIDESALSHSTGPVEVSTILSSNTCEASANMKPRNTAELPESVQRLLAESAAHWANLYADMLCEARTRLMASHGDCDAPEDMRLSDFGTVAGASAGQEEGEDGMDPFDTGPSVRFPSRARAAGRLRGEPPDEVDAGDSDHEGDTGLCAGEGSTRATCPVQDLSTFVSSTAPRVKAHISSAGPGILFHPGTGLTISCPGRVYGTGLTRIPQLADNVPTFDTARDLFKAGLISATRALKFFVLDGFVSDHVALQQTLSRMYGHLAAFEEDTKRVAAMQSRRGAALAPLLTQLSPSAYPTFHTELSLESAHAYRACFEARLLHALVRARGRQLSPADALPVREAAEMSLTCYAHFLRCYKDARLPANMPNGASNASADPLPCASPITDATEAHAIMTAHYAIARLLYRLPFTGDVAQRTIELRMSLARLEWIREHAGRIAPVAAPAYFAEELRALSAMILLLPRRIQLLETTGRDVAVD